MGRHSHTELSDRLFSLMKRMFETDSSNRVLGINTFTEMAGKLKEEFKDFFERFELVHNLANWDLDHWLQNLTEDIAASAPPAGASSSIPPHSMKEKEFGRISFDNVFRYWYAGKSHWYHGGVKVMYKPKLSWTGDGSREAEWGPIMTVFRPGPLPGSPAVECNQTTEEGVVFISRPPDLRSGPRREAWDEKQQKSSAACKGIIKGRWEGELSSEDKKEWRIFEEMYRDRWHSGAIPNLPATFSITGSQDTAGYLEPGRTHEMRMDGSPKDLKTVLKEMARFDRPLITWDIFEEEAPTTFPTEPTGVRRSPRRSTSDGTSARGEGAGPEKPLRDPREVNNVTHLQYPTTEWSRNARDLDNEKWARSQPAHVEPKAIKAGGSLCIVSLDENAEGPSSQMGIGLAKVTSAPDGTFVGLWYERASKKWEWAHPSKFTPWPDAKRWANRQIELARIRLVVPKDALCKSSKESAQLLDANYVRRLEVFCKEHGLWCAEQPETTRAKGKKTAGTGASAPETGSGKAAGAKTGVEAARAPPKETAKKRKATEAAAKETAKTQDKARKTAQTKAPGSKVPRKPKAAKPWEEISSEEESSEEESDDDARSSEDEASSEKPPSEEDLPPSPVPEELGSRQPAKPPKGGQKPVCRAKSTSKTTQSSASSAPFEVDGSPSSTKPSVRFFPLPEGWQAVRHETAAGRVYHQYHGPKGARASSRLGAWRLVNADHVTAARCDPKPIQEAPIPVETPPRAKRARSSSQLSFKCALCGFDIMQEHIYEGHAVQFGPADRVQWRCTDAESCKEHAETTGFVAQNGHSVPSKSKAKGQAHGKGSTGSETSSGAQVPSGGKKNEQTAVKVRTMEDVSEAMEDGPDALLAVFARNKRKEREHAEMVSRVDKETDKVMFNGIRPNPRLRAIHGLQPTVDPAVTGAGKVLKSSASAGVDDEVRGKERGKRSRGNLEALYNCYKCGKGITDQDLLYARAKQHKSFFRCTEDEGCAAWKEEHGFEQKVLLGKDKQRKCDLAQLGASTI